MSGPLSRPALVVSHERSGTHFLMNTLALHFGYRPYTDLDRRPGFDPASTPQLLGYLFGPWPAETVLKSHHQAAFFPAPLLPRLAERFHVFYVVRDPRDVLLSFWRYVSNSSPETGPQAATLWEFVRAAPCGLVARYQRAPLCSMAERWRVHVEGWLKALEGLERAGARATWVRYDDLDERFAATVGRLAEALGRPVPAEIVRPSISERVVHPGDGGSGKYREFLTEADVEFLEGEFGATMRRLGFGS